MIVTSPAYADGAVMPARFATVNVTGGTGASVPLSWDDAPTGTQSFVLAIIDTHPVAHGWVHWLVTDIPVGVDTLAEGASNTASMPPGAVEQPNTAGRPGYGGPQPPVGSGLHDYVATIYALGTPHLDIGTHASWEDVRAAMQPHVLDSASVTAKLGR
jgi:hypothetical protein